ncbi:MAG TPA: peptidoglycan DD-metalloendopeptidase family protein [Vicinamibacterales bacterium]|nr:peptidoglycan DD-metalloendopeptidase family protein [Vicinamibacterales bacterium]
MASRCSNVGWRAAAAWLIAGLALSAQQSDRERTEALASRAGERLQALQREADRLAAEERGVLTDLQKLEIDRQIKAEQLKQVDADAAKVAADLDATTARLASLQSAEAAARPELRARIVELYKLGEARYLRLLLSTPDLRRIGDATRTVAALAKLDRDRVAQHAQTLAQLQATRKALEARSRQLAAARASAEQAKAALDRAAAARNALVADIDRRRDVNAQFSGELMAAQQKLQAALRQNVEAGVSTGDPALPLRPFKGDLDWPAPGTVRGRFGGGARGNGIELDTDDGATVRAIHEGTVAFAGPFGGFGNLVIVQHGGQAFSLYGDLLELAVQKGARVDRGQPLGTAGATPSGLPGVYFELRIDGQPVDPLQWLRRR